MLSTTNPNKLERLNALLNLAQQTPRILVVFHDRNRSPLTGVVTGLEKAARRNTQVHGAWEYTMSVTLADNLKPDPAVVTVSGARCDERKINLLDVETIAAA